MGNVRIELNRDGVRDLLRSAELGAGLRELAEDTAARAGDGFAVSGPYAGRNRVNVSVYVESDEAWQACLEDNALLVALEGGAQHD